MLRCDAPKLVRNIEHGEQAGTSKFELAALRNTVAILTLLFDPMTAMRAR